MPPGSTSVRTLAAVLAAGITLASGTVEALAAEPPLPAGLGGAPAVTTQATEPGLPAGLGEPSLPTGLGAEGVAEPVEKRAAARETGLPLGITGFWETRLGRRTGSDPDQSGTSIGETRLRIEVQKDFETSSLRMTSDFLYDSVEEDHDIDLEEGRGWLDLREANYLFRPASWLDIKAGRQILTWGTGDLIFINDLFPKDWNSFFIGRDTEYLKAPSDAVKGSFFTGTVNVDLVYTPRFDPDRFIDGRRVSYFNPSPSLGRVAGRSDPLLVEKNDDWFDDDEIALRLYRNLGSYEAALYGYDGFWKSPNGSDPVSGRFTFPRLTVAGASVRGPIAGGIGSAELGFYDSRDDRDGDDLLVRNSELRVLVGYERELAPELTGGFQYYLERMADHDAFLSTLPLNAVRKDENRHVLTLRLTQLLMNQNLNLSLFNFYSPSDEDGYLRVNGRYKVTDAWQVEAGGNLFYGVENNTFFGQFEDASNLYAGIRFGF